MHLVSVRSGSRLYSCEELGLSCTKLESYLQTLPVWKHLPADMDSIPSGDTAEEVAMFLLRKYSRISNIPFGSPWKSLSLCGGKRSCICWSWLRKWPTDGVTGPPILLRLQFIPSLLILHQTVDDLSSWWGKHFLLSCVCIFSTVSLQPPASGLFQVLCVMSHPELFLTRRCVEMEDFLFSFFAEHTLLYWCTVFPTEILRDYGGSHWGGCWCVP